MENIAEVEMDNRDGPETISSMGSGESRVKRHVRCECIYLPGSKCQVFA